MKFGALDYDTDHILCVPGSVWLWQNKHPCPRPPDVPDLILFVLDNRKREDGQVEIELVSTNREGKLWRSWTVHMEPAAQGCKADFLVRRIV